MQDRNPTEMITNDNHDNREDEIHEPEMEVIEGHDIEDDDDDDLDDDDGSEPEGNIDGNVEGQGEKPFDPNRQLKNLTQISHESNDSLRRRRKRAKVSKLQNRGGQQNGNQNNQNNNNNNQSNNNGNRDHRDNRDNRDNRGKRKGRDRDDHGGNDFTIDFDPRSETEEYTGFIQLTDGGHAFMRSEKVSFTAQDADILVPREIVSRYGLRSGHKIHGIVRGKKNRRQKVVTNLMEVQDQPLDIYRPSPMFHTLTSVNPFEFYRLSSPVDTDKSMILLELLTPIGKGQRGLIVAPPRTGKTILMEKIANGINYNHPEADVIMLLIDERPEEVTHLTRKVKGKVYASCLDKPIEEHIALTQMVIDIAQRKVESGKDVVILLDSITRMSRAFNNQLKSSGRTLSGGVDAKALQEPKKFFGAARKLEEGGSLTIIATTLVQTGSQMDEVIFQEFKGTGNMELVLNRRLAEKRIYPAIDIAMSGTRREELILPAEYFKAASKFRRYLSNMTEANQMPAAIQALEKFKSTSDFVVAFQ
ncbi:MAG: rho [Fibrobacteres bacterium]|nr:rho [Fibrobacterota bacterium]